MASEQRIALAGITDPRQQKVLVLAAAQRGPTAIDDATGMLYVLRQREVERLLHERRMRGIGLSLFDLVGINDGPLREWYGSLMFTNEGATHDRLRRLVSKAFTPRAVGRLRPIAAAQVVERLAPVRAAGGGDLVTAFAGLPMHLMGTLLGVPTAAIPDFVAWVDALGPVFGIMQPAQVANATAALEALTGYVRDLVEQRSFTPADDLITSLIRSEDAGDQLTRDETVTMVVNLLVGGHETTASQIGCTLLALLTQPHAFEALRSDAALLPAIVSETIRFEPSVVAAPRTVGEPLEIEGVERPAGAVVLCSFLAANRDAEVWHDAEIFVPNRFAEPNPPRLLSFGGGAHFCLGAALARMTLEEVVRGVASTRPQLTADPAEVDWMMLLGRSPAQLPVAV